MKGITIQISEDTFKKIKVYASVVRNVHSNETGLSSDFSHKDVLTNLIEKNIDAYIELGLGNHQSERNRYMKRITKKI